MSVLLVAFMLTSCGKRNFDIHRLSQLRHDQLREVSGIAVSRINKGLIWVHNDSGSDSDIYLLDQKLSVKLVCRLSGATSIDWEDMAIGPGPDPEKNYLYVGDIGDNAKRRTYQTIYRLEEPVLKNAHASADTLMITHYETFHFKLPHGARNAEALLVHPQLPQLYLLTKEHKSSHVYSIDLSHVSDTILAKSMGTISVRHVVAADLSATGEELLVKNYLGIYYWRKKKNESIQELIQIKPVRLRYRFEPQGEAIAWDTEAKGFYVLSERPLHLPSYLFYYQRR